MRKQDLKVGTDYAISRWNGDGPHQGTYLGEVEVQTTRHSNYSIRGTRVIVKEHRFRMTASRGNWSEGDLKNFPSRWVIQPWADWLEVKERRRQSNEEYARKVAEVREQMEAAVTALGIVPRRALLVEVTLGASAVTLNGEELVALAERFRKVQP